MRDSDLVERLLAQNDRLIDALTASSPVEVIRALNPPPAQQAPQTLEGEWAGDPVKQVPEDPWGDDSVPLEVLRGPIQGWRSGWVAPPGTGEDPDGPGPVSVEEVADAVE